MNSDIAFTGTTTRRCGDRGHMERCHQQTSPTLRRERNWRGHVAEWLAAVALILRGYRILARRHRTPYGEIDLVARRGRRLAFVEVKRRPTIAAAEWSLTPTQAERIGRAAEHFVLRRPQYRDCDMGMDLVLFDDDWRPRYLANAFHAGWDAWRWR